MFKRRVTDVLPDFKMEFDININEIQRKYYVKKINENMNIERRGWFYYRTIVEGDKVFIAAVLKQNKLSSTFHATPFKVMHERRGNAFNV